MLETPSTPEMESVPSNLVLMFVHGQMPFQEPTNTLRERLSVLADKIVEDISAGEFFHTNYQILGGMRPAPETGEIQNYGGTLAKETLLEILGIHPTEGQENIPKLPIIKERLLERHIPATRINYIVNEIPKRIHVQEPIQGDASSQSYSTESNIKSMEDVINATKGQITLISSPEHILRIRHTMKNLGIEEANVTKKVQSSIFKGDYRNLFEQLKDIGIETAAFMIDTLGVDKTIEKQVKKKRLDEAT